MAPRPRNTFMLLASATAILLSLAGLPPAASVETPPTSRASDMEIRVAATPPAPEVPLEVAPEPAAPAEPAPVAAGPDWSIAIDTSGYQPELDLCLWVRMDFDGVVPVVGAHNYCGGDFILTLSTAQTVQLSGLGLDGTYVVTDARNVFSGDDAIAATSGMSADVILQTCYWDAADGMRLVALTRA